MSDLENASRSSRSSRPKTKQILAYRPYEKLLSYQRSNAVYLATVKFTQRFLKRGDRTIDQMIQAARSGKQNIVEGSMAGAGSKQSELFLTNVARASLAELLEDYKDFLNVHGYSGWDADSKEAQFVRKLCRKDGGSYENYREFVETRPADVVANIIIVLIHQTCFLLDKQVAAIEEKFLEDGGLKEKMSRMRIEARKMGGERGDWHGDNGRNGKARSS